MDHSDLVESRLARETLMTDRNLEIINKVKEIAYLDEAKVAIINQVADYYEVSKKTINTVVERNREEFEEDGMTIIKGEELKEIKGWIQNEDTLEGMYDRVKYSKKLTVFPRRAILRVGMLLRDSDIAQSVRNYLLNVEEVATYEQKEWSIKREASKLVRRQLTDAIQRSGENERMHGFAYANYTDLVYNILFGLRAKDLKKIKDVDNKYQLRDCFCTEENEKLRMVETTIAGLLNANFEYDEIKERLNEIHDEIIIQDYICN
ncbi:MAG: ORF6N domain-containing protein [Bacillota bacterium]